MYLAAFHNRYLVAYLTGVNINEVIYRIHFNLAKLTILPLSPRTRYVICRGLAFPACSAVT